MDMNMIEMVLPLPFSVVMYILCSKCAQNILAQENILIVRIFLLFAFISS